MCHDNENLVKHLQDAGVSSSNAVSYATILKRNQIDLSVLPGMTANNFKSVGISSYEDCLDIVQYLNADTDDCAGIKNPCKHGGVCQDGFKCFSCHCGPGYFGKTCEKKCPCHNNGRCSETSAGVECDCPVGFAGRLCENRRLTQHVVTNLQSQLSLLTTRLSTVETKLEQRKNESEAQRKKIEQLRNEHNQNMGVHTGGS